MADRTVRVRLQADLGTYTTQMTRATTSTARFGEVATAAGRGVRVLGADSDAAAVGLAAAGTGARAGATGLRAAETAAASAGRGLAAAGTASRGAFATIRSGASSALAPVKSLGLLLAGGSLIYGIHKIVEQGNEYNDSMLKFSEVTRASGAQMQSAGREAQALGADMKLPSANAAEAADAMVDLAKAGLGASDAIKATRGTIQLAAAARTDVATAAQIEGDIMDQFALKSTEATHVADVLANTANSASGQLVDLYYAMKYLGPTAHSLGISLNDAATAVGLLGKSGIIGETAGTSLRGALVNVAKATPQMKKGLKELGIQAFDSQGQFKGLEYMITQLHTAQEHLTQQQFTSAAAMAFGKPALSAMTALAHQGGEAFEQFGTQVGRVGGAANIAAAESKGLGGAMRGLGKQISSTFLQVYLGISPVLENITRDMTSSVSSAIPYVKRGIKTAGDLWTLYGPTVESHLHSAEAGIGHAAAGIAAPLHQALVGVAVHDAGLAVVSVKAVDKALRNAGSAAVPLESGLKSAATSVTGTSGAVGVLSGRLEAAVGWAGDLTGVLKPIASVAGGLAHDFAALPGPIQLSVISMLALRPFRGQITSMQNAIVGYGRRGVSAVRGVGDALRYQQTLAASSGLALTRFGAGIADLQARYPVIRDMGTAFRTTSYNIQNSNGMLSSFRGRVTSVQSAVVGFGQRGVSSFRAFGDEVRLQQSLASSEGVQLTRMGGTFAALRSRVLVASAGLSSFRGAVGGTVAALGVGASRGLIGAGRSLVSFLGGPWGIAIAGAMIGLDQLAKKHQQAAQAEADHQQRISSLAEAIQQSNGAIDANVRATAAQTLQDAKLKDGKTALMDVMDKSGVSLTQLTDAYLGGSSGMDKLIASVSATAAATLKAKGPMDATTQAQVKALQALKDMSGEVPDAIKKQKDLAAATKAGGTAADGANSPTSRLQDAISTLGDSSSDAATKASALHTALDLLSGGELDVQAAVADMNQSVLDLNSTWKDGVDKSKGWKDQLLQVDGSLNTTSENGQDLFNKLQALNQSTASAAQSTYDYANANGESSTALKQAEARMQTAYDAAVKAAKGFGLTSDQAQVLAAQMGFIPSNLVLTMSTPGLSQTEKDLLYVQGLAGHLPKGSSIKVTALTSEATKDIEAIGYKVTTLPGGRQMEITAPTDKAAKALDALIAKKIPAKTVTVKTVTDPAIADLQAVQDKLTATKGKSVTVKALTADAQKDLKTLGYKVTTLPNKKIQISVPTSQQQDAVDKLRAKIAALTSKTVTLTVRQQVTAGKLSSQAAKNIIETNSNGSVRARAYADGGTEDHTAQIAPAGAWRLWAEPETGGEAYIPLAPPKRERSRAIAEETVKRLGGKGIAWAAGGLSAFADGGFTYTPGLVSVGTDDPRARFDNLVGELRDAWSTYQQAVKDLAAVKKDKKSTAAEKKSAQAAVSSDLAKVKSLDSQLGLPSGSAPPSTLNLKAYQKQLADSVAATTKWRANLAKIGAKGGSEVEQLLADMGTAGYSLVNQLAGASTAQFNAIVANLKKLDATAQASIADYTQQMTTANTANKAFQQNLLKLAAMGDTALASQLASQGDDAAVAVAAAAVKSTSAAAAANKAAAANAALLSSDDLSNAVTLLGVLRSKPGAGIADVIAAGLDWATISALVPKIASQIKAVNGSANFVAQVRGQGVAMARGGILTQPTNVLAAEAGKTESWIPWDSTTRSRALLARTATAFGYHLTPMTARGGGGQSVQHIHNHRSVTLNGAKQTAAEQAADIVRHMSFVG
ncbi:phage tail tape measure protein [Actinacidiphila sp. bgisy145]|uniref:phage tail tape measure protein n=1 Tax=Actinacidiphila sp. bgisy145 TaxID=3413792 RepID=UPI003EBBB7B0